MIKKNMTVLAGSVADLAGRYLCKHGAMTEADLHLVVDFGCAPSKRSERLERAIRTGWIVVDGGQLACGTAARAHYDQQEYGTDTEEDKPIGQIAMVRAAVNVFDRPTLSAKHIPNRRGMRQDVPEWSVRATVSFKSVAEGES